MSQTKQADNQQSAIQPGGHSAFELTDDLLFRLDANAAPGNDDKATSLVDVLEALGMQKPLVVTGRHFGTYRISSILEKSASSYQVFSGFSANPSYEEVVDGVRAFREQECDSVISVGGGSAIDVAKCIKLFAPMSGDGTDITFVGREAKGSAIPHIAIPSTAGTGSEATHFAVIYVDGKKHSVTEACLLPDIAILDPSMLESLPPYQKKATLLDALCQAIESYWSRRSCAESREYSSRAIPAVMNNALPYLDNNPDAMRAMHLAAYWAGRAINVTTTTAPHAMSYKLTSQFGIPHGHAVALCMPFAWKALAERGDEKTQQRLADIARLMTQQESAKVSDGLDAFTTLLATLELPSPEFENLDAEAMASSVNVERLSNFPLDLAPAEITEMYESLKTL